MTTEMFALEAFLILNFLALLKADPIVHSPWGIVRGIENVTEDYTMYNVFLGIPFAVPPVGERRFTRPVMHPGFNYTFNATSYGKACLQDLQFYGVDAVGGDEDCLTLNIFTPVSLNEFSNIPVMVWIYGGGFVLGKASDEQYYASPIVARGNVIVVTLQYRLGPFGFLSTGDDVAKGNYGLWDQNLAIQWVKKNIRSFGGDDNRITIFGESAGSASVAFQAFYPGSKGLFQRTIMQSGSVTSTFALKRNPLKDTMTLARKLKCLPSNKSNHTSIINCLRNIPSKTLAAAAWPTNNDPLATILTLGFVPTIDKEFIEDEPRVLINDQNFLTRIGFHERDCMVSVVSNEGGRLILTAKNFDKVFNSTVSTLLLNRSYYEDKFIAGALKLYFGVSTPAMIKAVASDNIPASYHGNTLDPQIPMDTNADSQIIVPTIMFAGTHSQLTNVTQSGKKTYVYVFDQSPSFLPRKARGLVHGEDVLFTFGLRDATLRSMNLSMPTSAEKELSNTVMDFLTNFARDGNPSPAVSFKLQGDWPEFNRADEKYLRLNTNMSIASYPYASSMILWVETLPRLLKNWNQRHHPSTQSPKPGVIG